MAENFYIDVCICTHNPKLQLFSKVLEAIANQTLDKSAYKVWIIDNASCPPIQESSLIPLVKFGIKYEILREPQLGIIFARTLAMRVTTSEVIVFVDDDNELHPDYLEKALAILQNYPEIGMCGGKLLLPQNTKYPSWVEPILPYLAIKDAGEQVIAGYCQDIYDWKIWEPPTAGSVIRRSVTQSYLKVLQKIPKHLILSRRGRGLLSCEDSLIAYSVYQAGLHCSYQPSLQLNHHIHANRFKFNYLLRLLFAYGRSYILLRKAINQPIDIEMIEAMQRRLNWWLNNHKSRRYLACMIAWELGFMFELQFYKLRNQA